MAKTMQEWLFSINQTTKIEGSVWASSKEDVKNVIEHIMDNLDNLIKCKKRPPGGCKLENKTIIINVYVEKRR